MELRHDACRYEFRDRHYRRWESFADEVSAAERKIPEQQALQVELEQKTEACAKM